MKKLFRGFSLIALASLAMAAYAQTASTSLRGLVKDPSGALAPGAKITLTDQRTGRVYHATTNASGNYQFPVLPPAHYLITAEETGFSTQNKTAELLVNQPATIDFTLNIAADAVTVDVSASAQTLNLSDATLGNAQNNETIQALPSLERNVPDLLSLQPGVLFLGNGANNTTNTTGDSRSGAVNGVRSDQGNVTLDGVDDNDQVNGYAFSGVLRETQDSVEEFRVTTANSNASDGRSAGAQISLVTKSGSNQFHGAAYEYYRPTFTVANDWFLKQSQLSSGEQNRPAKLIRNIFGAALGGPLLKDKLFFFVNYEGQRQAENATEIREVPTANYQKGLLSYTDTNGNTQIMSSSDFATLDAGCTVCNSASYGAAPGANPYAMAYFQSMPAATGTTEGDGLNTGSYTFSSPKPLTQNTTIARIDWSPSDRHKLFFRGNLQKDTLQGVEQFPGQGASTSYVDNSKGFVFGHTWTISPTLVNEARYGYTRQGYANRGVGSGDYVDFRFMDTPTAETRSTINSVPVNNIIDNITWSHGNHTVQAGGNWRLIYQNRSTDANSYNSASTNPAWLSGSAPGVSNASSAFSTNYARAYANLVGSVSEASSVYNYKITSATAGSSLSDGAFVDRHFKANEFEWFIQDSWKIRPNLTVTFGLRHSILQTPWETHGQQVAPSVDTHEWFEQREASALQGQIYEPLLTFSPSGPAYGKPGYWPKAKDNFAPRLAVVYSPDGKTSIRMGAGLYYNHYGQSLVSSFDQHGSYGMSSSVNNPANTYSYLTAPRFTGRNTLPYTVGSSSATQSYPYTPASDLDSGFATTWGIDTKLKTPYSEAFNLSVQRELGKGFMLEVGYVGTLGRHLLQSLDLAQPVNYVDPNGGGDYFTAARTLSQVTDANGDAAATVASIPYFENVFPFMKGYDYAGESATQAIYNNEWMPYRINEGETTALADLDIYGVYSPAGWTPHFYNSQFASLYALSTIGSSYYHAGQLTLRHPMSHGYQIDLSYTLSHSIDMGSDAERSNEDSTSTSLSAINNTWKPALNRASSDFDTRQLLTVDGIAQLPVGRGQKLLPAANRLTDALVGGWQLSGLARVTSGLPFTVSDTGWNTDWNLPNAAVVTGKVKMRRHIDSSGNMQFFDDPDAINNGVATGGPIRLSYPGEAGQRNHFRGDGYFDIDAGLTKVWATPYNTHTKFAWEVYNVTNSVRFDPEGITSSLTYSALGRASTLLSTPRRMQFSLRVDF